MVGEFQSGGKGNRSLKHLNRITLNSVGLWIPFLNGFEIAELYKHSYILLKNCYWPPPFLYVLLNYMNYCMYTLFFLKKNVETF